MAEKLILLMLTVLDQNSQLQGPHPKEIYNHIEQLYLDAENAWQTTYFIIYGIILKCYL